MEINKEIEKKWQNYWEETGVFKAENQSEKEKYYYLVEFPYPSGSGLHVGHARSYTALDVMARRKRMLGFNVLFPMGWDAFGAPAEQYAIANKIHPNEAVKKNIEVFKRQIKDLGISIDWTREFSTTDEDYYKWTQYLFLKFFENDLAYKDKKNINWCPSCKTGLSNEEATGGECERCGTEVEQKEKEQWVLRMSNYAEDLISGLADTNFQEKTKLAQINWIGKSVGAEVEFKIKVTEEKLKIFTTRMDTIYGASFIVLAPEHPLLEKHKTLIKNYAEVEKYKQETKLKTEFERANLNKDKTGIKLEGIVAINPANEKELPIFVADYVMIGYGTGAIMAVPAHDDRDYAFAKKHNLEIIEVIKGGNIEEEPYLGEGEMINSGILNGINNKEEAIKKMTDHLESLGLASEKINYRLQDWIFSRQRFWGEPIPLVHCEKCSWVAVPFEELPVVLPEVADYEPREDGESPLANITEWVNTTCPKCGGKAKRETDTMPNWAGSSWYWLRYMDAKNDQEFASWEAMKYWGKVDFYNGGMEHAARHLLYARFWNQFFYNLGIVPNKEPFEVRVSHGMILGDDGEKMSKSRGNVINPDEVIKNFGADTLRTYEMFIGDYEKEVIWSEQGVRGCRRFLERVIRLAGKLSTEKSSEEIEKLVHKTIKKVDSDIENMKFNTAVSALMILVNEMEKEEKINRDDYRTLLLLLYPIAPHISEELNEKYELGQSLSQSTWPKYDEKKIIDEVKSIAVQVNGKLRGTIQVSIDDDEETIKEKAQAESNVSRHIINKEIIKIIVIKDRIVNIVIQ